VHRVFSAFAIAAAVCVPAGLVALLVSLAGGDLHSAALLAAALVGCVARYRFWAARARRRRRHVELRRRRRARERAGLAPRRD
jgi:Flp pilus assembly protein TadB